MTDMLFVLLGGVGLFLLGMMLMTDGLKLAAGPALEVVLSRWTSTRWRSLISGISFTALLQSSSAMTVATLGFVNSGLLTFERATWVIFGSNVGTTFTAWLVALLGFSIKIEVYAMPLVGLGAFLRIFVPPGRLRASGTALAGFGLLFLGIDGLKGAFADLGASYSFAGNIPEGVAGAFWMVVVGFFMTVLMQSSSAAVALILTALVGQMLSLEAAAAAVIGANIGTTSTALLAVIGATPEARRLAMVHVVFNVITGVVALLLLPLFVTALLLIGERWVMVQTPGLFLALFHSAFNLLGVLLMIPLSERLNRRLQGFFGQGIDLSKLQYLDANVRAVPQLAVRALLLELHHIYGLIVEQMESVVSQANGEEQSRQRDELRALLEKVADYMALLSRQMLPGKLAQALTYCWRIIPYWYSVLEALDELAKQQPHLGAATQQLNSWIRHVISHHKKHLPQALDTDIDIGFNASLKTFDDEYQALKEEVLQAASRHQINAKTMNRQLEYLSQCRRAQQQFGKARTQLVQLQNSVKVSSQASVEMPTTVQVG